MQSIRRINVNVLLAITVALLWGLLEFLALQRARLIQPTNSAHEKNFPA